MKIRRYYLPLLAMLAVTGAAAAAANYSWQQSWVMDGGGRWDYLEVEPASQRLFLTRGDRLQVLDLKSGKPVADIGGLHRAHGVAFAPKLGLGFASSGEGNSVIVFDLATLRSKTEVQITGQNPDAILYEQGSGKLYTFNGKSANASVLDAASMKAVATIAVSGKPEFAVSDGRRIYVNIEDKNQIDVIDIATDRVSAHWPLAGCDSPTGLAIDEAHGRLFSACGNGVLVVTDAANGQQVAHSSIGHGADAAVYDAERASVFASNGDGTLTVIRQIDADHYAAPQTVATYKGARTMAMDHATGRIFLPTLVDGKFTVLVTMP